MATVAKPKQKSSLPLLLGAGALLILVVVMTGGDSSTPGAGTSHAKKKAAKDTDVYTPADYNAHFAVFNATPSDVFKPLVMRPMRIPPVAQNKDQGGIPVALTGGEANWYYTGHVELNGDNEALFENTTSGESVYVKPGEGWKAARVQSVDISSVILVGPDGNAINVPLQQYGEMPGQRNSPVASNGPLTVPNGALTGAIGTLPPATGAPTNGPQRITLSNGQTLDLVPTDAANSDNSGNQRRRGRRNRNNASSQGLGDISNAP